VKKRISDVHEQSEIEEKLEEDSAMEVDETKTKIANEMDDSIVMNRSKEDTVSTKSTSSLFKRNGSKTVLISRNQAVEKTTDESNELDKSVCSTCKEDEPCSCENKQELTNQSENIEKRSLKTPTKNSTSTPDVLIQPASPAVLAAHNKKKSVITVTLRQRSPSQTSQRNGSGVSRSPSACSTASRTSKVSNASSHVTPDTLASIITVNGVTLSENDELNAEFASSLNEVSNNTEVEDTNDKCKSPEDRKRPSCHVNNTASYVHVTNGKSNGYSPSNGKQNTPPKCSSPKSNRLSNSGGKSKANNGKVFENIKSTNGCCCSNENVNNPSSTSSTASSLVINVGSKCPASSSHTSVPSKNNIESCKESPDTGEVLLRKTSSQKLVFQKNSVSGKCSNCKKDRHSSVSLDSNNMIGKNVSLRTRYPSCNYEESKINGVDRCLKDGCDTKKSQGV